MNGDDERDYAEEADVRAEAVREGLAEQAAERAQLVDGHMSGPAHYRAAERLLKGEPLSAEDIEDRIGPKSGFWAPTEMQLRAAQVHATLALAAATAANIRRNGALTDAATSLDELHKAKDVAAGWLEVLG